MSSLTRIVKSTAVVDDRPVRRQNTGASMDALINSQAVLKRHMMNGMLAVQSSHVPLTDKQSHLDELNRLKLEIAEAKDDLRALGRKLAEAREQELRESEKVMNITSSTSTEDLEEHAKELIEGARAQAEEIIAQANEQSAAIAEQAKNDGYLEGFSKGYEEAVAEFQAENEPKMQQLGQTLNAMADMEQRLLRKSEKHLVDLVMAISQKVIGRALNVDKTVIADMLRDLMEQNHNAQYIRVSLSKDLAPVQAEACDEVREMLQSMGANVTVLVDENLPEGGLVVETPGGLVDLSVGVQLENLHASIMAD